MQHTSIVQHMYINQMCKIGTWGTQVEIFSMATLFKILVYVASQNQKIKISVGAITTLYH